MQATISFDPTEAQDVQRALTVLTVLAGSTASPADSGAIAAPEATGPTVDLDQIIARIADARTYGYNRRRYLRGVAEAGDEGIDIGEWKRTHFADSHQKYGGTHSSIEKGWRGLGGERFAPALIWEEAGRHVMLPEARDHVLAHTADLLD